jgi:hypothetical protein
MTADMGSGQPFSWPVLEFARSIGAKSLAMLVGYFDDSGTHAGSPVCLLAGLISNTLYWDRLERDWKDRLLTRRNQGITWFHAFDCEHGFDEFKTTPRPLRESFAFGLSNVICKYTDGIVGLSSAVRRDDWNTHAPEFLKKRCHSEPYNFVVEHCLQQIAKWSIDQVNSEPVALVFAKRREADAMSEAIHWVYRNGETYQLPGLGALSLADPRLVVQLQAADLFAYEMYQYAQSYVGPDTPMRPVLANFVAEGLSMEARVHDKNSLVSITPRNPSDPKEPFKGFTNQ